MGTFLFWVDREDSRGIKVTPREGDRSWFSSFTRLFILVKDILSFCYCSVLAFSVNFHFNNASIKNPQVFLKSMGVNAIKIIPIIINAILVPKTRLNLSSHLTRGEEKKMR